MFMSTDEIQHKSIVNFPGGTVTPYLLKGNLIWARLTG
jgi:hypothetical protein